MVGRINIKGLEFTFVLRHRYEKRTKIERRMDWRDWTLSLWYKRDIILGTKKKGRRMFNRDNHVNQHMLGINLLIIKMWVTVAYKPLTFEIDD